MIITIAIGSVVMKLHVNLLIRLMRLGWLRKLHGTAFFAHQS